MRIEIWSDVVCPWCYIGRERLQKALERFEHRDQVQLTYRAFELDPTASSQAPKPTLEVLAARYGGGEARIRAMFSQVEQAGAEEGLALHLGQTLSGNTRDAHRLIKLAAQTGQAGAMVDRLYRAYFTEGLNVFEPEPLVTLAKEVGLDRDQATKALADKAFEDAIEQDQLEARQLGARGVPFFVVDGRFGISGAQPLEAFTQTLQRAWDSRPTLQTVEPVETSEGDAACGPKGCELPQSR